MKDCVCCYLIDALVNGEIIRKRKYKRENTHIDSKWYDYNGKEVADKEEINRLDGLAVDDNLCDCSYDDIKSFYEGSSILDSILDIPSEKSSIIINWTPGADIQNNTMSFKNGSSFDGDSFNIIVKNIGDSTSYLYAPSGDGIINIFGVKCKLDPNEIAYIKVIYANNTWYWHFIPKSQLVSWTESPKDSRPDRKVIELKNGDMIIGFNAENTESYNLAMINEWGVADYGSPAVSFNINSKTRPTIQLPGMSGEDAEDMAFLSDIPDKGKFLSEEDLRSAYPTAKEGNYAEVDGVVWIWHDGDWVAKS